MLGLVKCKGNQISEPHQAKNMSSRFKFNFFDSLLKLASGIIFYLLNLSDNLPLHTYKHC